MYGWVALSWQNDKMKIIILLFFLKALLFKKYKAAFTRWRFWCKNGEIRIRFIHSLCTNAMKMHLKMEIFENKDLSRDFKNRAEKNTYVNSKKESCSWWIWRPSAADFVTWLTGCAHKSECKIEEGRLLSSSSVTASAIAKASSSSVPWLTSSCVHNHVIVPCVMTLFFIIGVSLSKPHIDNDNGPHAQWYVSIYVSMSVSLTPRLSHPGSRDPCTPWNTLCIPVYWRAHMCDLQLHLTKQPWTTRAARVCCEQYRRRQVHVSECADTRYKQISLLRQCMEL